MWHGVGGLQCGCSMQLPLYEQLCVDYMNIFCRKQLWWRNILNTTSSHRISVMVVIISCEWGQLSDTKTSSFDVMFQWKTLKEPFFSTLAFPLRLSLSHFLTFGVAALSACLYQKQMPCCSRVEEITKVNSKDQIKGKWVITSQTKLVQEMEFVLLWLWRKAFHRKNSKYCTPTRKSLRTGNYFWRDEERYSQNVQRFILNRGREKHCKRFACCGCLVSGWSACLLCSKHLDKNLSNQTVCDGLGSDLLLFDRLLIISNIVDLWSWSVDTAEVKTMWSFFFSPINLLHNVFTTLPSCHIYFPHIQLRPHTAFFH